MKSLLFVALCFSSCVFAADWTYKGENDGVKKWPEMYDTCSTQEQSPINIDTDTVLYHNQLHQIEFSGYDRTPTEKYTITNNGHGLTVVIPGSEVALFNISGGGLPAKYHAGQFHWHWGTDDLEGSEHTINQKQYPLELHIVHFNEEHGIDNSAVDQDEGLAVLGFLFEIGDHNPAFDPLIDSFENLTFKGDTVAIDAFPLDKILPPTEKLAGFWRYPGGLTTPPCHESVVWTVFHETIKISTEQLAKFRTVYYYDEGNPDHIVQGNFRPVQELHGRKVYTNIDPEGEFAASSSMCQISLALLSFCTLIKALF